MSLEKSSMPERQGSRRLALYTQSHGKSKGDLPTSFLARYGSIIYHGTISRPKLSVAALCDSTRITWLHTLIVRARLFILKLISHLSIPPLFDLPWPCSIWLD